MSFFGKIIHGIEAPLHVITDPAKELASLSENIGEAAAKGVASVAGQIANRAIQLTEAQAMGLIGNAIKNLDDPDIVAISALRLMTGQINAQTFTDNMFSVIISSSGMQLLGDPNSTPAQKTVLTQQSPLMLMLIKLNFKRSLTRTPL